MLKAELISKLDSFALTNNLKKVYEWGKQMLPEKAAVLVAAKYELDDSVHIFVQHYLEHACFFAAAYDYDKNNSIEALKVAKSLRLNLIKSFGAKVTFHNDSQYKSVYNKLLKQDEKQLAVFAALTILANHYLVAYCSVICFIYHLNYE